MIIKSQKSYSDKEINEDYWKAAYLNPHFKKFNNPVKRSVNNFPIK